MGELKIDIAELKELADATSNALEQLISKAYIIIAEHNTAAVSSKSRVAAVLELLDEYISDDGFSNILNRDVLTDLIEDIIDNNLITKD